jgi:hypothetical protein
MQKEERVYLALLAFLGYFGSLSKNIVNILLLTFPKLTWQIEIIFILLLSEINFKTASSVRTMV